MAKFFHAYPWKTKCLRYFIYTKDADAFKSLKLIRSKAKTTDWPALTVLRLNVAHPKSNEVPILLNQFLHIGAWAKVSHCNPIRTKYEIK